MPLWQIIHNLGNPDLQCPESDHLPADRVSEVDRVGGLDPLLVPRPPEEEAPRPHVLEDGHPARGGDGDLVELLGVLVGVDQLDRGLGVGAGAGGLEAEVEEGAEVVAAARVAGGGQVERDPVLGAEGQG